MKLLLDETLGRSVAALLRDAGHDVTRSSLAGGPGLDDQELVEAAVAEDRVLVTLDEGFANTVRFDPAGTPGIVVISLPDEGPTDDPGPIDRMQASALDTRRAAADLATERYRLQDERAALTEKKAALAEQAAQAMSQGDEGEAGSLLTRGAAIDLHIGKLSERITLVAEQEQATRRAAEDLAHRTEQARTALAVDRAQAVIDAAGVEPSAGRLATPAALSVWGSLARDLGRALSQLLAALETFDPRSELWVAGVDGVKQYRDSA